jgi:hypothetical protein
MATNDERQKRLEHVVKTYRADFEKGWNDYVKLCEAEGTTPEDLLTKVEYYTKFDFIAVSTIDCHPQPKKKIVEKKLPNFFFPCPPRSSGFKLLPGKTGILRFFIHRINFSCQNKTSGIFFALDCASVVL